MTAYEKLAISLPPPVASRARAAVARGEAPSLSAYIAAALEERASRLDLEVLVDELLADTGGALTPAERRRADRVLPGSPAAPKRPSRASRASRASGPSLPERRSPPGQATSPRRRSR